MASYNCSQAQMIRYGELYWGNNPSDGANANLVTVEIRVVEGLGVGAAVNENESRDKQMQALILSNNMVTWGEGALLLRMAQQQFERTLATVNESTKTWYYQKCLIIHYYGQVFDHKCSTTVNNHMILGTPSGNKPNLHYQHMKTYSVKLLLFRIGYGWTLGLSSAMCQYKTLEEWGQLPENRCRFYMLVLPMLEFICTEMNPHLDLDPRVILRTKMDRTQEFINQRLKHGIWSEERLLRRIPLP